MSLSLYERLIIEATGCTADEAPKVEDLMRNVIFHSTLDWQTREEFMEGARQAYAVLTFPAL